MNGQTIGTIRGVDVEEPGVYTAWLATPSDALTATMVACDTPWCGIGFSTMGRDNGDLIVEPNNQAATGFVLLKA